MGRSPSVTSEETHDLFCRASSHGESHDLFLVVRSMPCLFQLFTKWCSICASMNFAVQFHQYQFQQYQYEWLFACC
jgi:hypothetical protein